LKRIITEGEIMMIRDDLPNSNHHVLIYYYYPPKGIEIYLPNKYQKFLKMSTQGSTINYYMGGEIEKIQGGPSLTE